MVIFPCKYGFKQLTYELRLCSAHFFKQNQLLKFTFLVFTSKNDLILHIFEIKLIPSKIDR